jgi:hypothetical protein
MLQPRAALGAELGQLGLGGGHIGVGDRRGSLGRGADGRGGGAAAALLGDLEHLFQGLGDGVGAGGDGHALLPEAGGAADPLELGDDLLGVHTRADGHAGQAGGGLTLAGTASGPAGVGEYLTDAVLVVVDSDIKVAAADAHLLGKAAGDGGARPRLDMAVGSGFDQAGRALAAGVQHGVHHRVAGGGLAVVDLADVEHLLVAASVPVDGGALAAQSEGQPVDLGDLLLGGGVGEVHRLAHRVVCVPLEGGLHFHMPDGGHVVGADEHPPDVLRDAVHVGQGALLHDFVHQLVGVDARLHQPVLQNLIGLDKVGAVHHIADIGVGEHRLYAGGYPGDDGQGAGGGDGGDGGVSDGPAVPVDALVKEGERAPDLGQLLTGLVADGIHRVHDLLGQGDALLAVVGHAHVEEHVRKAHDAQADLAGGAGHPVDLGQGVLVDLNHVVQEVDGGADGLFQLGPVQHPPGGGLHQVVDQVDGAQVAALIGQQRLLSAGVGGLDLPLAGHHVVPVQPVQEDDARLAGLPGRGDNGIKDRPGAVLAHHPAGGGVHQVVGLVLAHRLHKRLGDAHGEVEVGDLAGIVLAGDELQNIGVVHPQNPHVGAPAGAALLHRLGGGVEHLHKGDGAGGHAAGGVDGGALGPQAGEGEAGAAAALVDQRSVLDGVEDVLHGVGHRQHEAGGELAQGAARVHEGGGVGQEVQADHQLIKLLGRGHHVRLGIKAAVTLGHSVGHPAEQAVHGLGGLSLLVPGQVAPLQHGLCVFRNGHIVSLLQLYSNTRYCTRMKESCQYFVPCRGDRKLL